jgi:hypothetical protein
MIEDRRNHIAVYYYSNNGQKKWKKPQRNAYDGPKNDQPDNS